MKEVINIKNYQAYWVDYLDGKLNNLQEDLLFEFLEGNSALASSLIDTNGYEIPNLDIEYPNKEELYSYNQLENLIIAKIESSANDEDKAFINKEISKNKELEKSYELYKKTILAPDQNIIYPYKDTLKKSSRFFVGTYTRYLVAASIVLVLVAGFLLSIYDNPKSETIDNPLLSENKAQENIAKREVDNNQNRQQPIKEQLTPTAQSASISENLQSDKPEDIPLTKTTIEKNRINDNNNETYLQKLPLVAIEQIADNKNTEPVLMEYRLDIEKEGKNYYTLTIEYKKSKKEVEEVEIHYKKNIFSELKNRFDNVKSKFGIKETINKMRETREDLLTINFKNN
jgi:hypothetical protein